MNQEILKVAPEFGAWPADDVVLAKVTDIRMQYDQLLVSIQSLIPKGNERYLAIVKTRLEEACLFTVKAITKPVGN